jgi:glutamate decarboxylase
MMVLGGNMPTFPLNFSRPGGQVVAQYCNFVRLGREGFAKITRNCVEVGTWIADEIRKVGIFDIVYDGRGGVPGCTWTIKKGAHPGFTLYDLADRLRLRGWQVPDYLDVARLSFSGCSRVLARLGHSRDLAGLLVDDLKRAIHHFKKNPPARSRSPLDAGGYHHN